MKNLFIVLILVLFSFAGYSQEYDDIYFNRKDRRKAKVHNVSSTKHINPEYIARYTSKPKVKHVQTYHNQYRYNYSRWNISFGYHHNPYSYWNYNPYWYDYGYPYYGYNYNHWYPYGYSYYNYNYYGGNYYHYIPKTYVMRVNTNTKYQKRRTDRNSIHIPDKQNTRSQQRINQIIRKTNNYETMKRPSRTSKINTYRGRSNSYQRTVPSRSKSNYSTPSRSKSNYNAPTRSSTSSRSSGSRSSGRRQ